MFLVVFYFGLVGGNGDACALVDASSGTAFLIRGAMMVLIPFPFCLTSCAIWLMQFPPFSVVLDQFEVSLCYYTLDPR